MNQLNKLISILPQQQQSYSALYSDQFFVEFFSKTNMNEIAFEKLFRNIKVITISANKIIQVENTKCAIIHFQPSLFKIKRDHIQNNINPYLTISRNQDYIDHTSITSIISNLLKISNQQYSFSDTPETNIKMAMDFPNRQFIKCQSGDFIEVQEKQNIVIVNLEIYESIISAFHAIKKIKANLIITYYPCLLKQSKFMQEELLSQFNLVILKQGQFFDDPFCLILYEGEFKVFYKNTNDQNIEINTTNEIEFIGEELLFNKVVHQSIQCVSNIGIIFTIQPEDLKKGIDQNTILQIKKVFLAKKQVIKQKLAQQIITDQVKISMCSKTVKADDKIECWPFNSQQIEHLSSSLFKYPNQQEKVLDLKNNDKTSIQESYQQEEGMKYKLSKVIHDAKLLYKPHYNLQNDQVGLDNTKRLVRKQLVCQYGRLLPNDYFFKCELKNKKKVDVISKYVKDVKSTISRDKFLTMQDHSFLNSHITSLQISPNQSQAYLNQQRELSPQKKLKRKPSISLQLPTIKGESIDFSDLIVGQHQDIKTEVDLFNERNKQYTKQLNLKRFGKQLILLKNIFANG